MATWKPIRALGSGEPILAMRSLPIVVAVDVDPDYRLPGMSGRPWTGELEWRGLSVGIPQLLSSIADIRDGRGRTVRFTWLLRSDEQMATLTGDTAFVARKFGDFWRERVARGDEVGWHPHLWRFSDHHGVWYHETRDEDWMISVLREGHSALARVFPIDTAKTGWTFHTNATMTTLAELGLRVDISGIPGMRHQATIPKTDLPVGVYDWSRAPEEPYRPRKDDYQMPGDGGALKIVEIPNTTFLTRGLVALRRELARKPSRDFADPVKRADLVDGGFSRPRRSVPFVCYFHPEELLLSGGIYDVRHFRTNLQRLLASCAQASYSPEFVTAGELAARVPA